MKTKTLLLLLMLALGLPWAARAQEELTVFSDASFAQEAVPVCGEALEESGNGFFKCEFIIPASELDAMTGKMISVMSFYLSSPASTSWGNASFNVFLKEVDETVFNANSPAFYGIEGATTVYSGSLDATASTMDVFFDCSYNYGGGNLLIGIYQTDYGTGSPALFSSVIAENAAYLGYSGNSEYCSIMPCLPKTTFSYSTSPVSCYKPRNLKATVGTTASMLNWTNGHEETSWQLVCADAPFDPTTVATSSIIDVNTKPYTISGLTTETTYYAYLRANCGDSYSDWSAVCSFTPTNSLTLTVNEGGMYEGGFPVPIYSYYANNGVSSQFIIPANELASVMNGQITKLTFYNMSSSISWGDAEFKVYLGEMEANEFDGTEIMPWSEMTEVYNGALSVIDGMMEINLAIPYSYNTDNLVVGFNQTVVGAQGTSNDMWYGVSSSGCNNVLYNFGYSYVSAQAVPKTTIHYTQGTPPQCVKPRNLQAEVTSQTATLNWQNGLDETSWEISYSTTEGTPETGTLVSTTTKPFTVTGLTTGITYYAYIRANCGDSYSAWSTVCSFTPTDAPTTVDLTVYNGTYLGSGVPIQSQYTNFGVSSQYIIPSNYLTNVAYGQINSLMFYCNTESVSWGEVSSFKVYLGETDAEHFTGSNVLPWDGLSEVYSGNLSVSESILHIIFNSPYNYEGGNLVVGIQQTANGTTVSDVSWFSVADGGGNTALYGVFGSYYSNYYLPKTTINYTPGIAPTCLKPTGLSISQGAGAATLTWAAGDDETHWNVQFKTAAAADWSASIPVENTPTCTLDNLSTMTTYQVRVQADCGSGDVSGWVTGVFTTPCGSVNVPYAHDFDSDASGIGAGLPPCWTQINDGGDDYPYLTGSNAYSGPNCMLFYRMGDYGALNQIAVLPEMDAVLNTLQISFYAKLGSGTNEPLSIGVMSDPENTSTFEKFQDVTIASTTYSQYTVSFETYNGVGGYIALKCERGSGFTQIYVDDLVVASNGVCFAPTVPQISGITANIAILTWTPGSDVTNWQVQYKKTTDTNWSEPVAVNGTPSYTFSNLDAATTYQTRVRTNCGNDNYSDWVDAENFTTDCGFMTLPYNHDFDDDATGHVAPTCWHFSDGTYPYVYESSSSAHSGNHYLQIKKNTDYAATLVLPAIDTDEHPISTLKMTFWAKAGSSTYYYDYLYAGVMTDPNDMSTFQSVIGASTNLSTTTYKQFELYFDNWTGEGNYIALRYGGNTTYYIDDIEISVAPTCRQPLDLRGNYSSAHEANIQWKTRDLRQCNYQVSYSTTEGFEPENGTIVDVEFENTLVNAGTDIRYYNLTCLQAETTYYFYVRANCGNGDFSEWSDNYASLTTREACDKPTFASISVKNTYVKFEWNGDIDTEWDFQYKESSSETWITPDDFVATPGYELYLAYTLHGLTPGTEYEARLRRHCGMYSCPEVDDGYSDWEEESFTTFDGCWDGDPWMCTSHLGTQATVRWLNSGPDMRWQIRYRLSNEDYSAENIVTTGVLPEASLQKYTLTGLQPNSTYYWEVRGYCDEDEQSDWSDEDYFFTRSTDGYITVDKAHPYYEDFENGMPEDWSRMNLYNYDMEHYDAWECVDASSLAGESFPPSMCISSCRENMSWASDGSMILMPAIHIDENATSAWLSFWSKDAFNANDARGTKMIWVNDNYLSTEYTAFDLGGIYQKSSKAGYWRKCFVNLSDFIGQTIIIAFDYIVTHNYNNYDWWVDNVCVQVFDKVGGGENVTSGEWNNDAFWGGSTPGPDDDVIINANVTIPDDVVAQANNIVINTDTINTGNRTQKFGKLIIADGGQLITNNAVEATAQKTVSAWTTNPVGGWYFVASPVNGNSLKPVDVGNMLTNETSAPYSYDLYKLNGTQWENYHAHNTTEQPFCLQNGKGYLYANATGATLEFNGEIKTYDPANNTVPVSEGWNLIGNPYTFDAYPNTSYYVMNTGGTALDPQTKSASMAVSPCEGIIVKALDDGSVAFSKEAPAGQAGGGNLQIALTQANTRGADRIDNAIVSFNAGDELPKFYFGESLAHITIHQNGEDYSIISAEAQGELPLNFKTNENGSYTLRFSSLDTEFSYLHLIDNLTGNDVDLLETPSYTFDARHTDYASRFKIVFVKDNADWGDDFAFVSDGKIIINGNGILQIIDVMGRVMETHEANDQIVTDGMTPGVYVLRLIDGDNVKNQKIIIK